ncbi:helix-turn-helix domain-containing protein [Exiguobacterium artemiae]|uniref:helix-turn-helix domain-containing protein n=1 Tax=Exiguobacterium artemiae TaxID=340145 RepID=UPI003D024F2F
MKKEIGLNLRNARIRKKMAQIELAAEVDLSRTSISKYENGKGNPTLQIILNLSAALEIHPSELFQTD